MNGALLIDKPSGMTSRRIVDRVVQLCGTKQVGHAGTLDPLATGLLVVLLGKATRLQDIILCGTKEYEGVIRLGVSTDSDDITGQVIAVDEKFEFRNGESLEAVASRLEVEFLGTQLQTPPVVSALKVAGRRSYALAREGVAPELVKRSVTFEKISLSFLEPAKLSYCVRVSKGTYVRALARDIGLRLGSCGCLESIRRTRSEPFSVAQATRFEELGQTELQVHSLESLVESFPRLQLNEQESEMFRRGNQAFLREYREFRAQEIIAVFDPAGRLNGLLEQQDLDLRIRCVF